MLAYLPPPPMMVMQPLPVSSAKVDAIPKVPFAKASNSNTPKKRKYKKDFRQVLLLAEIGRERERERKRRRQRERELKSVLKIKKEREMIIRVLMRQLNR